MKLKNLRENNFSQERGGEIPPQFFKRKYKMINEKIEKSVLQTPITKLNTNNEEHLEIYYEYKYGDDLTPAQCVKKALAKLNKDREVKLNRIMLDNSGI